MGVSPHPLLYPHITPAPRAWPLCLRPQLFRPAPWSVASAMFACAMSFGAPPSSLFHHASANYTTHHASVISTRRPVETSTRRRCAPSRRRPSCPECRGDGVLLSVFRLSFGGVLRPLWQCSGRVLRVRKSWSQRCFGLWEEIPCVSFRVLRILSSQARAGRPAIGNRTLKTAEQRHGRVARNP